MSWRSLCENIKLLVREWVSELRLEMGLGKTAGALERTFFRVRKPKGLPFWEAESVTGRVRVQCRFMSASRALSRKGR